MSKYLFVIALILTSWIKAPANTDLSYEVILYEDNESIPDEENPEGQRHVNTEIYSTISSERIILHNFDSAINLYEVDDALTLFPIATFTEEKDFLDFIFSYTGEVRIRLLTDYYPLVGYIRLNNQN
ncbi:MAG: hypothetical protein K2G90_10035 [Muribaculaceae bacterium]|nr:hypothetical protein [Muribaculaceae bacterium]